MTGNFLKTFILEIGTSTIRWMEGENPWERGKGHETVRRGRSGHRPLTKEEEWARRRRGRKGGAKF